MHRSIVARGNSCVIRFGDRCSTERGTRSRGCSIEILAAGGGPLGWLPREDEQVLEAVGADLDTMPVRVIGIVPAFQRPRIQIELVLPETDAMVAPAA